VVCVRARVRVCFPSLTVSPCTQPSRLRPKRLASTLNQTTTPTTPRNIVAKKFKHNNGTERPKNQKIHGGGGSGRAVQGIIPVDSPFKRLLRPRNNKLGISSVMQQLHGTSPRPATLRPKIPEEYLFCS